MSATVWLHGLTGERMHCFFIERQGADLVLRSDIALCGARVAKYGLGYRGSEAWKNARQVSSRAACARAGSARIAWNWIHPSRRLFAARERRIVTRKRRFGEGPMPEERMPKRKFPKSKWKRGLCQQRGCRLHVKGRAALCKQHLAARKEAAEKGG